MSTARVSKGEERRRRKQRDRSTKAEVVAFTRGMQSHQKIVGPSIKRRAALIGLGAGVVLGAGATLLVQHLLGWWHG